jgi:hypothetical protein
MKDLDATKKISDIVSCLIRKIKRHSRALAIILNMFDSFKQEVLDALTTMFYPIYDMDPLHLLANKQITNNRLSYIGSNLWEEQSNFTYSLI